MARYVKDLVLNKPEDFVTFIMNDYLQKNQFVVSEWKGEPAYRTGDALIEGYKYLKWSYENGTLHLEAWMKSTSGWIRRSFAEKAVQRRTGTALSCIGTGNS